MAVLAFAFRARLALYLAGALTCVATVSSLLPRAAAAPPVVPLETPYYSFDAQSPKVMAGLFTAADILQVGQPNPSVVVPGSALGLNSPNDAINGLSAANQGLGMTTSFVIMFSVDRATQGAVAPEPSNVAAAVPYNVQDQAAKGQAAGDLFMSAALFDRSGLIPNQLAAVIQNNVLAINNYDEGGTDYAADPETSAAQSSSDPQDNVTSSTPLPVALGRSAGGLVNIYFSATAGSPSLLPLSAPQMPSGANIFFHPDPSDPLVMPALYASFQQLGLFPQDDINAMIVIDANNNGQFDGNDQVIFSLTGESPSLEMIPGTNPVTGRADLFSSSPGLGTRLYVSGADLGLGALSDNIDALMFLPCNNAAQCAAQHGIRSVKGDFNDDGQVDATDFDEFEQCYTGPGGTLAPGCEKGDFDGDGDIDCADWLEFRDAWTAGPPLPDLAQCPNNVPAASQWGLVSLALLVLAAGTALLRRRFGH